MTLFGFPCLNPTFPITHLPLPTSLSPLETLNPEILAVSFELSEHRHRDLDKNLHIVTQDCKDDGAAQNCVHLVYIPPPSAILYINLGPELAKDTCSPWQPSMTISSGRGCYTGSRVGSSLSSGCVCTWNSASVLCPPGLGMEKFFLEKPWWKTHGLSGTCPKQGANMIPSWLISPGRLLHKNTD